MQYIVVSESLSSIKAAIIRSFSCSLPSRPDQDERDGQFRNTIKSIDPMQRKENEY